MQRKIKKLNRGVFAVPHGSDSALVSWRMLATDLKKNPIALLLPNRWRECVTAVEKPDFGLHLFQ